MDKYISEMEDKIVNIRITRNKRKYKNFRKNESDVVSLYLKFLYFYEINGKCKIIKECYAFNKPIQFMEFMNELMRYNNEYCYIETIIKKYDKNMNDFLVNIIIRVDYDRAYYIEKIEIERLIKIMYHIIMNV